MVSGVTVWQWQMVQLGVPLNIILLRAPGRTGSALTMTKLSHARSTIHSKCSGGLVGFGENKQKFYVL